MKRKNAMILLGAVALTLSMSISACGNGKGQDDGSGESSFESEMTAGEIQDGETETGEDTQENEAEQESEELNGDVESIDENSFIINKIFTKTMDDGTMTAVSNTADKTLITVHFSESTSFIIHTVKNSGASPSDITYETGSKDDLKPGCNVIIKGSGTDTEFTASEIVIYHFI